MTAPRGWCPGVFTPMAAPDGLLVRVKPRAGGLPSGVARRIAHAAAAHGNGRIELTCRANLQIRGLSPQGSEAFARAMVACGAADADPATERRRNIVVSPLAGPPDRVAAFLEQALAASDLHLPAKFGFAVEGGGVPPLGDTGADIVLHTVPGGCRVQIASARRAVFCTEAEAPSLAVGLARAFLAGGGTRRMRDLVGILGEAAIYAAAGACPDRAAIASTRFAAAPDSGQMTAESLLQAAALAESSGSGVLRVAPWRSLVIDGLAIAA